MIKMNAFFNWLKWLFSKRLRYDVKDFEFTNVKDELLFAENGVFYKYNIRYSATNCTFIPYKEPEPNVMDLKIDMGDSTFNNHYIGKLNIVNNEEFEPIISRPSDVIPFTIVSVTDKPLLHEDRWDKFCDALVDWNKRMERYEVTNMNVKVCDKDKNE